MEDHFIHAKEVISKWAEWKKEFAGFCYEKCSILESENIKYSSNTEDN